MIVEINPKQVAGIIAQKILALYTLETISGNTFLDPTKEELQNLIEITLKQESEPKE